MNPFSRSTHAVQHDMSQLAENAAALVSATADVAGDQVAEARHRLSAVLDRAKDLYGLARDKALDGGHAADEAARDHLYATLAMGVGAGLLAGYLFARSCRAGCR